MNGNRYVRRLGDLGVEDVATAGGKGAGLGELIRAGLPVPPGFVVTAQTYLETVQQAGLRDRLARPAAPNSPETPGYSGFSSLTASESVRQIRDLEIPAALAEPILAAYRELGEPAVAVRSSATTEDAAGSSFAGMYETFTNVRDGAELLTCITHCWASAYGARAIAYRADRQILDEPVMAVVVQIMVRSERSGVVFSADPRTGDQERTVIEGAFGLGEVVAAGRLVPDTYLLDRRGPRLLEVRIGYKDHMITSDPDGREAHVELPISTATSRVLSDDEALALTRLALRVQDHYGCPQDIEWAVQDGVTYLLQSRPLTVLRPGPGPGPEAEVHGRLVAGLGAAPGVAYGSVRVLASPDHTETFHDGEILVAPTTTPEWMPILHRAAAIVTDGGGITCHTAIISRELAVPAIVGTRNATQVLYDGQRVRVDGLRGVVEEGQTADPRPEPLRAGR